MTNIWGYVGRFYAFARLEVALYIFLSLLAGILEGVGVSILVPLLSFFMSNAVDSKAVRWTKDLFDFFAVDYSLANVLLLLIAVFFLKAIVTMVSFYYRMDIREILKGKMQKNFIDKLCLTKFSWYKDVKEAQVNNTLVREVEAVVNSFEKVSQVIASSLDLLIYTVIFLLINDWTTVACILPVLVLLPFFLRLARRIKQGSKEGIELSVDVQDNLFQVVRGFKYLKVKQSFTIFQKRLDELFEKRRLNSIKVFLLVSLPSIFSEFLAVVVASTLIWFLVLKMSRPISEVLVTIVFIQRLSVSAVNWISNRNAFWAHIGSLDKYYHFIEDMSRNEDTKSSGVAHVKKVSDKALVFDRVSFNYGQRQVLKDVSFSVAKGERIGIVGASGGGKTTLFDLALGLLRPHSGQIFLGGAKLDELSHTDIANIVGFVPQDPVVFNDSPEKNIYWYVSPGQDFGAIGKGLNQLLEGLGPEREGDTHKSLSGGQRQKIAFFRELISKPEVLFIDEGTSALDAESESEFLNYMHTLDSNTTVFMVAHRLSSLRHCNRILVLNNGSLVEEGSWEELLSVPNGFFGNLLRQQTVG